MKIFVKTTKHENFQIDFPDEFNLSNIKKEIFKRK